MKRMYKLLLQLPAILIALLCLTSHYHNFQTNSIYHLNGRAPQNRYNVLTSKYMIHTLFRNDCVDMMGHSRKDTPKEYLHPRSRVILANLKMNVPIKKLYEIPDDAPKKQHIRYSDQYPKAHVFSHEMIGEDFKGEGKNEKTIIESAGRYTQAYIVDKHKHKIKTINEDNSSINLSLDDHVHYLSAKQYKLQQIQNHEYKIFMHISSKKHSNRLFAYVPLHKLGNSYYYKISSNEYINAKYIDKINGHLLIVQNVPCYSKLFGCYGCISNVAIGQRFSTTKPVFESRENTYDDQFINEHNSFYLATAHLNSIDPSNPFYNPETVAHLTIDGKPSAYISHINVCSDVANVMPAVYLNTSDHPFPLKSTSEKGKTYLSDDLNQKLLANKKYQYMPYMLGAMTVYGINPMSDNFFDFDHRVNKQIDKIISNRPNYLARPISYYYNVKDTDTNHAGLLISDSYCYKYIDCPNDDINLHKDWSDFYKQSGYYMCYPYEKIMHLLFNFMYPDFLYTKNLFYTGALRWQLEYLGADDGGVLTGYQQ